MDPQISRTPGFRVESHDGITVVHLEEIGPDAREPLYGLVENEGHTKVVLNLSDIDALSSFALGILANFQKKIETQGGRLKMCCLNPNLAQLFRLTKFDQIFSVYETQYAALRAF